MSNSEGPKGQVRSPGAHDANQGKPLRIICFPKSKDVDLRQTYPTPRRVDQAFVPTASTLPPTPSKAKELTEHQHKPFRGKTAYRMPRGRSGLGNRTVSDTVLETQTKVIGKENRRGWKVAKVTKKTTEVRRKADKWSATHGRKAR